MSFLSPAFLLALPLVGIPILIHLFARRQRQVVRWGAMDFLMRTAAPKRRFLRLRDLILMLIRAAIVLAIIAALAQPMISSQKLGSTGPRDVIVVFDNSLSTARTAGGAVMIERELEIAERVLDQLGANDMVRVMTTSPRPDWLTDGARTADSGNIRDILRQLRELKPNMGSADILESVHEALKADAAGPAMPRFVTVITDGQAANWKADATNSWAGVLTLTRRMSPPAYVSVVAVEEPGRASNLSVEKISATRSVVSAGQPVTLTTIVKNTGSTASVGTSVTWTAGGQPIGSTPVPVLEPGGSAPLRINQSFGSPGVVEIACAIDSRDELEPDNAARFLVDVTRSIPVLFVEGERRSDPLMSDTQFFLAALGRGHDGPPGAFASVFQPKVIGYADLEREELSGFRCVVLGNISRINIEVARKLSRYVNSGGGLWITLGSQTDVPAFNTVFFEHTSGLVPLPLGDPVGDAENRDRFISIVPPEPDHPATALLADIQRLDVDKVRVFRRHQFQIERGTGVSTLLRVEGGAPVAVEKSHGRGRVIVQAVPLGPSWSSLPLRQTFVVMVNEWLWYLTEPGLVKRNLQAGELIEINRSIEDTDGMCSLETPGGRTLNLTGEEIGGRTLFRFGRTLLPGDYRAVFSSAPDELRFEQYHVNRNREESDLSYLQAGDKLMLSSSGGVGFGDDPFEAAAGASEIRVTAPPKAFAQWILAGLIALLALEAVAAYWFGRPRRVKLPGLAMSSGTQRILQPAEK